MGVYSVGVIWDSTVWMFTGLRPPRFDLAEYSLEWGSTVWGSAAGGLQSGGLWILCGQIWIWQSTHLNGGLQSGVYSWQSTVWKSTDLMPPDWGLAENSLV